MAKRLEILFIMDEVASIIPDEDTTFALMRAAEQAGHRLFHCGVADLSLQASQVHARCAEARCSDANDRVANELPVNLDTPASRTVASFDVVWIRKDPPFDAPYLWLTLLLERVKQNTLVLNDPRGLREANEKLYTCWFAEWMPETIVSAHADDIRAFTRDVGGKAVLKPIDGHGGAGVFALSLDDPNFNAIVETLTRQGTIATMAQRYLPEVVQGDKRILVVEGEALGAIVRVPSGGDLRSNIHVGGKVTRGVLSRRDRDLVEALAPKLRQDGLWFTGLDVVGGMLTEVNVTSPTGIQQMSRFDERDLSAVVIRKLEAKLAKDD